jgi:lipopolysaccharide biosynthesis glycosyltransferase
MGLKMVHEPISIVLAADEAFAMPMAITVKSVLLTLPPFQKLHVYVMDVGLSETSRRGIAMSWDDPRMSITWLSPRIDSLASLPITDHLSHAAYARLLIADLLPASVERVIYLDSDLLVLRNLGELWQLPMESAVCLAVQDIAAPWFDCEIAMRNYTRSRPYLAATQPITNYRKLGLSAVAPYFNSGVLVIDVMKWRALKVARLSIDCLESFREHVLWLDQYALNIVLNEQWRPLDWRWNQGTQIYAYPRWQDSPLDRASFRRLRSSPFIVHFTSKNKPWHLENRHPWRRKYFKVLDQTAWAGWRPGTRSQRIAFSVKQYWMWFSGENHHE